MQTSEPPFLKAEWLNLVMLNYEIDPMLLSSLLPASCELDIWQGKCFVSMVGFQFLNTHIQGIRIPFHTSFEEINLRFYVKRKIGSEWRRGVVFIKEIAPKRMVAVLANRLYGENYVTYPTRHKITKSPDECMTTLSYEWQRGGGWESLTASYSGESKILPEDSEESFITEHYWGYARRSDHESTEYQVVHPRWRVWHAKNVNLQCDVATLYGSAFASPLSHPPSTAFIADGSKIVVRKGRRIQ